MAARTGMSELITKLRAMTNSGTADYTVAGGTYWSDDHLQESLDRVQLRLNHVRMNGLQELNSGTIAYKEFMYPDYETERNTGGDSVFRVTDANGSVIGTADYTVNYEARRVTFTADQGAELRYISANAYDMHAAAEDVWMDKSAHYQASFDFATDNHDLKRSQLIKQALAMAKMHSRKRKARQVTIRRLDVN